MVRVPATVTITPYHPGGFTVTWQGELGGAYQWKVVQNLDQLLALLAILLKEDE